MGVPFLTNFFWELLSILSLTMFGVFWLFDKISHEKYPMMRLVSLFLFAVAALVVWARVEVAIPPFWVGSLVDLVLAIAMTMLAINFIILILEACSLYIPHSIEKSLFILTFIGFIIFGIYLFTYAPLTQFSRFDALVAYWIRPAWILVVLTLLTQIKVRR